MAQATELQPFTVTTKRNRRAQAMTGIMFARSLDEAWTLTRRAMAAEGRLLLNVEPSDYDPRDDIR